MRTCSRKEKDKLVIIDAIDEKPVRLDMAFAKSNKVSGQIVIVILFWEWFHSR